MPSSEVRERIIEAATKLLAEGGPDAMTTRAVSAAAGVHAPTIYRIFGDKDELLDAVVSHGFTTYLNSKRAQVPSDDPVEDLRRGWDLHLEFGLTNPTIYATIFGPRPEGRRSPAERQALEALQKIIHRIAEAGRLAMPEDLAAQLLHAAGSGIVLSLIATPEPERDPQLPVLAREAAISAITTDTEPQDSDQPTVTSAAITLRAALPKIDRLTDGERLLMAELLDKIARSAS